MRTLRTLIGFSKWQTWSASKREHARREAVLVSPYATSITSRSWLQLLPDWTISIIVRCCSCSSTMKYALRFPWRWMRGRGRTSSLSKGSGRFARPRSSMEIQNRRLFPVSFGEWRSYSPYRYAHIYFVLDSVRKLSEVVSRATFGPQTSARELFSTLCLDLSLPEVSNCFREKSRGQEIYYCRPWLVYKRSSSIKTMVKDQENFIEKNFRWLNDRWR